MSSCRRHSAQAIRLLHLAGSTTKRRQPPCVRDMLSRSRWSGGCEGSFLLFLEDALRPLLGERAIDDQTFVICEINQLAPLGTAFDAVNEFRLAPFEHDLAFARVVLRVFRSADSLALIRHLRDLGLTIDHGT